MIFGLITALKLQKKNIKLKSETPKYDHVFEKKTSFYGDLKVELCSTRDDFFSVLECVRVCSVFLS